MVESGQPCFCLQGGKAISNHNSFNFRHYKQTRLKVHQTSSVKEMVCRFTTNIYPWWQPLGNNAHPSTQLALRIAIIVQYEKQKTITRSQDLLMKNGCICQKTISKHVIIWLLVWFMLTSCLNKNKWSGSGYFCLTVKLKITCRHTH